MINRFLLQTILLFLFLIQLSGCAVWVPYESRYLIDSPNHEIQDNKMVQEISTFLEVQLEGKGMKLHEKYRETYPDDFSVIVFEFVDKKQDNATKTPSLCVRQVDAHQIKVSYRIWYQETMTGKPVQEPPIDMLSILKDDIPKLVREKFGVNVNFTLIEEKKYSSGDCKVW